MSVQDTDSISLCTDTLIVRMLPAAGGNIHELVDRRTGRNWLWNNPNLPLTADRCGDDYGRELDSGGWDEILLSVTPDEFDLGDSGTVTVPDHGDLVRRRWRVQKRGPNSCELSASGSWPRYEFRRSVTVDPDRPVIEVGYSLTNEETLSFPWFWCAHALIAVEPGMQIELPNDQPFRVDSATTKLNPAERTRLWPAFELPDGKLIDLADCFAPHERTRPFAGKFFVRSPDEGCVSVRSADGRETLTMSYGGEQLPWLGLWINNEGWSGCQSTPYRNLGLEPATMAFDSVSEAIENGDVPLIRPGETKRWSVIVELAA